MWKFGIGALVVAAALGVMTYTEGTLAFKSSAEPEEISLKKLIDRGPDGNAYIILTDFVLCDNLVNEFNQSNKDRWTKVWIPVVTADEAALVPKGPLNPSKVKALFFSTKITNHQEIEARLHQPKVQAMVTNRIVSLDAKVRNLLQQSYPGTNFDECLIIQEGRTPFSRGVVYLFGVGAVVALAVGLGLLLLAWQRKRAEGN
jgi:hypothetical protein